MEILAKYSWALLIAATGLVLAAALLSASNLARAQGNLEYMLTLKYGYQDPTQTNDTAIEALESIHGEVQGEQDTGVAGLEFDILAFPSPRYGVGLGLEYHVYDKILVFQDPAGALPSETIQLKGKAFLYILKFYAQTGILLNYIGFGSGNYFLQYHAQNSDRKFRGSSEEVFTVRVGTRMEFGEWSALLEYGETRAPERLFFLAGQPRLELGGRFWNLGVGYAF